MKFSALYQSHDAMREPCFRMEIDGKTLENTPEARLLRFECELTSNRQAGMLCLKAALNPKDGHGAAWLEALQPGAVCALSLGYAGQTGNVFSGFLYDVMWDDPLGQEVILLDAVCLDVRGRLMLAACAGAGAKRNASQLIGDILDQPCCTQLSSRRTVQPPPEDWDLPLLHPGLSDYSVVCRAADFFCYEFYAFGEELYFGKPRPESSPAVIFDGPNGLLRLSRRTLAGQCAAVAVGGTDGNGERIYARHPRRRDSGFGAARMAGALTGDLCLCGPWRRPNTCPKPAWNSASAAQGAWLGTVWACLNCGPVGLWKSPALAAWPTGLTMSIPSGMCWTKQALRVGLKRRISA